MIFQWLISAKVRDAVAMCKHVHKILNHQRDILRPEAVAEVQGAINQVKKTAATGDREALKKQLQNLEAAANKWLKSYPNAAWRENVEVLLVALAVAMGIRTFFLQPFKIPTGSMQPTLFGVTSVPDFTRGNPAQQKKLQDDLQIPGGLERVKLWFEGFSYIHIVADTDGELQGISQPMRLLIFNIKQTVRFAGRDHTIWFPPDYGSLTLEQRAGVRPGDTFRKGEDVIKLQVRAGDHLFVDRLTYNFIPPSRGQIVVFETKGIGDLPQDQFYIKRLVALPGETVHIGNDRHLIIDGTRLDVHTPHFEFVYSFDPKLPARESQFSGHVNQKMIEIYQPWLRTAQPQLFTDETTPYTVSADHFMVMGDNTMNSLDSRYWGDFPARNVIGRAFSVYWPITERFGWACVEH